MNSAVDASPVLVTGASGFVGSAIAETLRAAGHRVRVLVRPSSSRANISPLDTVCEGDITDRSSLASALKGARFVFHAAADYRLWARDPDEMARNNVEGTRLVMEESLRAGVERVVYTSSVATLKLSDGKPADESRPLSEDEAIGPYKRSKAAAERLVEAMARRDGLPAVIVNPSTPIGPRDVKPTPTGRVIVEAASGRIPAFVDTGLNLVHVDDVAAGHLAALRLGRVGERYILGGENVLFSAMLADVAAIVGRKAPTMRAPRALLYPLAYAAEFLARARGSEPFLTLDGLRMSRHLMFFDDAKARRELGYSSRPYREGLEDAVAWFKAHGRLKMIVTLVALVPVVLWAYLLAGRGWFWLCRERDDLVAAPASYEPPPSVTAVIPARDEAGVIALSVNSLLKQDFEGSFAIVIVDDQSSDGTADAARAEASALGQPDRVRIVAGSAAPQGWTGKLWAMRQGLAVAEAGAPEFVLFTDADIAYSPQTLRRLVAIARSTDSVLVSLMAKLRSVSVAERLLAPAFIFFFQKLYPFAWVNDPRSATAAAAGGCMLVRREALAAAGGLETLRDALIDDCALAVAMKRQGAIWLGLTEDVHSLRAHPDVADFGGMIVRSAFAQLRYSTALLIGTIVGMAATYLAPPLFAVFGRGAAQAAGAIAWALMALAYAPMLRFYRQPAVFSVALPAVAAAYTVFTIESAVQHWRGRGGSWKGRYQASTSGKGGA